MKRMTLLTALALVFSLFTVTAAIAGSGPGAGDGEQAGEPATSRTATQVQARDGECQVDDCQAGEMTQTQEKEQVGECKAGDDCPAGDQVKTQAKTQTRVRTETQLKECQADDCQAEEALMKREQIRERLMNQILAMLGAENADVEGQYRLILNLVLQNTLGFRAMFI